MNRRDVLRCIGAAGAAALVGCGGSGGSAKILDPESASQPGSGALPVPPVRNLRVALVTPSALEDGAYSQSMFDGINAVIQQRGAGFTELATSPGLFKIDEARAAIVDYAEQGFDLVVAHGSQFGGIIAEIAPAYPTVSFAWGTAGNTFGHPNVFAYEAASQEGGYVLGRLAAHLSATKLIGVIGPVESGDARLYVRGFTVGVNSNGTGHETTVTYTGSYSDTAMFEKAARQFTEDGITVLTGSSQGVAGAVPVVESVKGVWLGTQSNQTAMSPSTTAASQVYHWEGPIADMLSRIESGAGGDKSYRLSLTNSGLQIETNPAFALDKAASQVVADAIAAVAAGNVDLE